MRISPTRTTSYPPRRRSPTSDNTAIIACIPIIAGLLLMGLMTVYGTNLRIDGSGIELTIGHVCPDAPAGNPAE